jgi:hypothetical protein
MTGAIFCVPPALFLALIGYMFLSGRRETALRILAVVALSIAFTALALVAMRGAP